MRLSFSYRTRNIFTLSMLQILLGLVVVDTGFAQPQQSAAANRQFDAQSDIVYATVDGHELKLDLYVPQNTEGPLPLVVWIHGGAWLAGDKANTPALALLEHGFAVASVNYRFSNESIFPAQIHDCKAAIRFLRAFSKLNREKYNIDPDRIGVWGDSAGGHLVALLGTTSGSDVLNGTIGEYTDTSDDVQAVCDWYGPSDMFTMPIGKRQFPKGQDPEIKLLGGRPDDKPELAKLCSPATHVSSDDPPFLIMHGDQDRTVPLQQSQLLYDKLKAAGVDAKLIVMEGKGHGFGGPEAIEPVVDFFKRTLQNKDNQAMFDTDTIRTAKGDLTITFIGHGTLMFQWAGKTIHIDPWTNLADYTKLPDADVILITHAHRDHLDPKAIEQIRKDNTTILMPAVCADAVSGGTVMENGDTQMISEDFIVKAVPAYNIVHKRSNGQLYHPKGQGNGYVLTLGNTRVYVAGDTENIPEMANLENIDIAFLPMNLPYTMTPEMVADAARSFKPKILYPYHYGNTDVNKLVKLLEEEPGIEIRIRKMP